MGISYEVLSARHNDCYTLIKSDIEEKLRQLQDDQPFYFKMYGDSAYFDSDVMSTANGIGMSSCRQTIEWDYKDVKMMWKYCDYSTALQLRKQDIGEIFFLCLLLRNAHVCLNACQAAEYFDLHPPSLELWTSQGMNAKPLPPDSPWNPYYVPDLSDADNSDEEVLV